MATPTSRSSFYAVRHVLLVIAVAFSAPSFAQLRIAHRGLFHDVNDNYVLAENSVTALFRAAEFGLAGVELDLRLTQDGVVVVTHDLISNRATIEDNFGGRLNPIDVTLNLQPAVSPEFINSRPFRAWNEKPLKVYSNDGRIITNDEGVQKLESLEAMLIHFKNLAQPRFILILDIQDPVILKKSAALVKQYALNDKVYLKFFAKKAIDSTKYKYQGAMTCSQYAVDNGLAGLRVIPQINDGELTVRNGQAILQVFQTELTVPDYLSCWSAAQQAFGLASAQITMVSASVPARNQLASDASEAALDWAKANGRQTMSIQPNPDAGRKVGTQCRFWTWQSNSVRATLFDEAALKAKQSFINQLSPDYVVVDLMGDVQSHVAYDDFAKYTSHLC